MSVRKIITTGAVVLMAVASMGAAHADFVAYNDCLWLNNSYFGALNPNVTNIQEPDSAIGTIPFNQTISGYLKDYNTGAALGAKVTMTNDTANPIYYEGGNFGSMACAVGTDAYNTFNGIVDLNGFLRYGDRTGWWMDIEFSGLNPLAEYSFVTTANRASTSYTDRLAKFTISGADSFTNSSSVGTVISADYASTTFNTGSNTANGYVASWTKIKAGSDGTFKVRAMAGGTQNKSYVFQAFKLAETSVVPEPGSILALVSGLVGLSGYAIRRKK